MIADRYNKQWLHVLYPKLRRRRDPKVEGHTRHLTSIGIDKHHRSRQRDSAKGQVGVRDGLWHCKLSVEGTRGVFVADWNGLWPDCKPKCLDVDVCHCAWLDGRQCSAGHGDGNVLSVLDGIERKHNVCHLDARVCLAAQRPRGLRGCRERCTKGCGCKKTEFHLEGWGFASRIGVRKLRNSRGRAIVVEIVVVVSILGSSSSSKYTR